MPPRAADLWVFCGVCTCIRFKITFLLSRCITYLPPSFMAAVEQFFLYGGRTIEMHVGYMSKIAAQARTAITTLHDSEGVEFLALHQEVLGGGNSTCSKSCATVESAA
ncbi:UNVERIFIED_CONTAM: hypothetical protein K2H54_047447 [Gekko kuhli]